MTDEKTENVPDEFFEEYETMYSHHREELIKRKKIHNQQRLFALTSIAAIIGYAFETQTKSMVAITPLILGVLYLEQARLIRDMARSVQFMIGIEEQMFDKIRETDDSNYISWEKKYGGYYGECKSDSKLVDALSPTNMIFIMGLVFYFLLILVALQTWNNPSVFGNSMRLHHLAITYVVFSVLMGVPLVASHYRYKELDPKNEKVTPYEGMTNHIRSLISIFKRSDSDG